LRLATNCIRRAPIFLSSNCTEIVPHRHRQTPHRSLLMTQRGPSSPLLAKPVWRELLLGQRVHSGPVNYAAISRKDRAVTGTVPGSVSIIPCDSATFVCARRGDSARRAVALFPHRNPTLAKIHDGTTARLDVETMHA